MERQYHQPMGANEMAKFGGPTTFMRLPALNSPEGLDVCIIGVPLDIASSYRVGSRFGPRAIRAESPPIRPYNMATRTSPFDVLSIADIGDVPINPYNLVKSVQIIEDYFDDVLSYACRPISLGGDHTIVLPILRAIKRKHGAVGIIHVDAHSDINDTMSGEKIAHGTPFRRAHEEGLIDPSKVVQIGLRGTGYSADDFDWSRKSGFRVVQAEACWHKSLTPLMAEVRQQMGSAPVYVSFDIDALDPGFAPGTGTLEIGGLTVIQAIEIMRGCQGLNLVGGDLVEVSPPYDPQGVTSATAANLVYELLCSFTGIHGGSTEDN